jgi:hypothetical protein
MSIYNNIGLSSMTGEEGGVRLVTYISSFNMVYDGKGKIINIYKTLQRMHT